MRKIVITISLIAALAATAMVPAFAAYTRIDVNGGLDSSQDNWDMGTTVTPYNWSRYNTQATQTALMWSGFTEGSTSNTTAVENEEEGRIVEGWRMPQGHFFAIGDSGQGGAGQYGIKQTFQATAGKLYWFTGSQNYGGNNVALFNFGLNQGSDIGTGFITRPGANMKNNSGLGVDGSFSYGMVAQNTGDMTAFVGHYTSGETWLSTRVDGLRIWEFDINVNSDIVNGNFQQDAVDVTDYDARWNGVETPTPRNMEYMPGWLMLGAAVGQVEKYTWGTTTPDGSTRSGYVNQWKGYGRNFLMQRVNKGAGKYDVSSSVLTQGVEANGMMGVDFTGGLDPYAASVQWVSPSAINLWSNTLLSGDSLSGNGITIFLASGYDGPNNRAGGNGGTFFDNVSLTFAPVPEPSSMLALASGLVGMAGVVIRRRRS